MKISELRHLSDESLKKLDEDGYNWGAESVGAYVKGYYMELDIRRKLEDILYSGKFIVYSIKCPYCNNTYDINMLEYNFNKDVNCYECGKQHKQNENIISLKYLDFKEL